MKWLMMSHLAREWYLGRIHFIFFSAIRFRPLLLNFSIRGTNLSVRRTEGVRPPSATVRFKKFKRPPPSKDGRSTTPVSNDSNRENFENELAKIRQFADLSR